MKYSLKAFIIISILTYLNILFSGTYAKSLSENSYIVTDYDTGSVLIEKNKYLKVFPASTTKILTCSLALENLNLDDQITVTSKMLSEVPRGSSTMKLVSGDTMTVKDLLYGLMLPSGNDAAIVVAHLVSGSTEEFVSLMNTKLKELGCVNTHFTNPHGFHDENHYTTAEDMTKIFKYALQNKTFLEIISTNKYTIKANSAVSYDRNYTSTNQLITNSKYNIYGKTGYTDEAGNVFVSFTDYNGKKLISVLLDGDKNYYHNTYRFNDTLEIYDYIYNNYSNKSIVSKGVINIKLIDKAKKEVSTYSNSDDLLLFTNSNNAKINYSINDTFNNFDKININIIGSDYYLEDMSLQLTNVKTENISDFGIDKGVVKIIIFIMIDLIFTFTLIIMVYVTLSILRPKKRRINKNHYNNNLYR